MQALRTQFDAREFSGTVATPTCCSCCCCCCCVTTAATASIFGAGAAAVAGNRRGLSPLATWCGAILGVVAPWLLIVPLLLSTVIPGYGGEIIPLLILGVLLTWAAYLALGRILRPHARLGIGTGMMVVVYAFGFFELLIVGQGLITLIKREDGSATSAFRRYLVFSAVVAVVVGIVFLTVRGSHGRTLAEQLADVPPRRPEGPPPGGEGE